MMVCLGAVWSSLAGLTRCSLGENCAGGDDEGDLGECTRWDEDFVLDVWFGVLIDELFWKNIGSFWNVTLFSVSRPGVLKGVGFVTSTRFLLSHHWGVLK